MIPASAGQDQSRAE